MKTFCTCLLWALWTVLSPAWAQGPSITDSKAFVACMDKVFDQGFVTENRIRCIQAERQKYEAMLREQYQQQLKSLQGPSRQHLVQGQRAWLKYRDAWCAYELSLQDLAPHPLVNEQFCLAELTMSQWHRLHTTR